MSRQEEFLDLLIKLVFSQKTCAADEIIVEVLKMQGLCQKEALATREKNLKLAEHAIKEFDDFCKYNIMFTPEPFYY